MKGPRPYLTAALAAAGLAVLAAVLPAQTTRRSLPVNVYNPCPEPTAKLHASPRSVAAGREVTLHWTHADADSFSIPGVGVFKGLTATVVPPCCGDVTYELTAKNDCGNSSAPSAVTVTVRERKKVWLSGSRYYTPPSVADYMWNYTVDPSYGGREGASVHRLIDASGAPAEDKARYTAFANAMKSWPRSAEAWNYAHVPGNTYIVDETGDVLGRMSTWDIFSNGLPGLNYLGNPWGNGDYNKVFLGHGSLNHEGADYDVVGFVSVSPIILDLDGDGKPSVAGGQWLPHPTRFDKASARMFDINGDGFIEFTEWLEPGDGLLVTPLADGEPVKGGAQLFGNPIGFVDGYQKLGMWFDKDRNGRVEGRELAGLLVWQDRNRDGRSEPAELRSVGDLGVTSIATSHKNLKSSYTARGRQRATWDWWPTCMIVYPKLTVARK